MMYDVCMYVRMLYYSNYLYLYYLYSVFYFNFNFKPALHDT